MTLRVPASAAITLDAKSGLSDVDGPTVLHKSGRHSAGGRVALAERRRRRSADRHLCAVRRLIDHASDY